MEILYALPKIAGNADRNQKLHLEIRNHACFWKSQITIYNSYIITLAKYK